MHDQLWRVFPFQPLLHLPIPLPSVSLSLILSLLLLFHFIPPSPSTPAPKQSTPSVYTLKAPSEDVMVDEKLEVRQRRTRLPCSMQDMADFSLWGILRKNIGESDSFFSQSASHRMVVSVSPPCQSSW